MIKLSFRHQTESKWAFLYESYLSLNGCNYIVVVVIGPIVRLVLTLLRNRNVRSRGACAPSGAAKRSRRVNVNKINRGEGRQVWVSLGVNGLGKQGSGIMEPWRAVRRRGTLLWVPSCAWGCGRGSDRPVPGERIPGSILSEHLIGKVCVFPNAEKNQLRKWDLGTSIITSLLWEFKCSNQHRYVTALKDSTGMMSKARTGNVDLSSWRWRSAKLDRSRPLSRVRAPRVNRARSHCHERRVYLFPCLLLMVSRCCK